MGKHSITLRPEQRQSLEQFVTAGTARARAILHAQVLLKADDSSQGPRWSDRQIEEAFAVSYRTILRIRKRFRQDGLQVALQRKQQPERPQKRKLDGVQEAQVIAVLCSQQPQGQERWTLRLLAGRVVELEIVQSISHETLRQTLKKMN
jgi:transposase